MSHDLEFSEVLSDSAREREIDSQPKRIDETKRKCAGAVKDKNACVVVAPRSDDLQEGYTPQ